MTTRWSMIRVAVSLYIIAGAPLLAQQMPPAQQAPPTADGVLQVDSLTLEQAVRIAREQYPALRGAEAGVRAANAGLVQARSGYFPSLSATASASRTDGWFVFNPAFPARQQSYDSYSAGVQLQQMLYDFGRTGGRVSAGGTLADAAASDLHAARDLVTMNVTLAYLAVIQAQDVTVVAQESVEQFRKHLAQAQAFFSVGRRPQIDVTKAEVDLANAEVGLIRARNAERTARLQLETAMGVRAAKPYAVSGSFTAEPFSEPLDAVQAEAVASRPDLQSARMRVDAARSMASAAWAQHLPALTGSAAYTWNGFAFPLRSRWNAAVTLSLPLFQGFAINAQVEQAEAAVEAAHASYDLARQAVALDVEQNYLALQEAAERMRATEKLVQQAEENRTLSEKEYAAGIGTPLEVTDAQVGLSNARITRIQALYDYSSALARLRHAIGRSIP